MALWPTRFATNSASLCSPTLAALSAAPVSSLLTTTTREPRRSRPSPFGSPLGAPSNPAVAHDAVEILEVDLVIAVAHKRRLGDGARRMLDAQTVVAVIVANRRVGHQHPVLIMNRQRAREVRAVQPRVTAAPQLQIVDLGALGAIADDGHRPERLPGLDGPYRHRQVFGSIDIKAAPHQQDDAGTKLQVGAGLDVQVMARGRTRCSGRRYAPRRSRSSPESVWRRSRYGCAASHASTAGAGGSAVGRSRDGASPTSCDATRRASTSLAGNRVDKHDVDVLKPQIIGSHA